MTQAHHLPPKEGPPNNKLESKQEALRSPRQQEVSNEPETSLGHCQGNNRHLPAWFDISPLDASIPSHDDQVRTTGSCTALRCPVQSSRCNHAILASKSKTTFKFTKLHNPETSHRNASAHLSGYLGAFPAAEFERLEARLHAVSRRPRTRRC